jgi:hypothetical protein
MPLTTCEMFPPAYNAPARSDVKCSWDIFLVGTFIYWDVQQTGMDLGQFTALPTATNLFNSQEVITQSGGFKPGFKVGLGCNWDFDGWVNYLEYTWLHGSNTSSISTTPVTTAIKLANWYGFNGNGATLQAATQLSSKWKVNLDMLDLTLSRPYYQGRNLTVSPFAGLRGAWIRQNLRLSAAIPDAPFTSSVSHNSSHSWGVGPRAGALGHWLLGWGFRLEGDMGASILFTRYTSVTNRQDALDVNPFIATMQNLNTVRPMADMGLGIGWGSYFDCQNFYWDISANYDFNYMWGQNTMRWLADNSSFRTGAEAGDLSYNGVTVTMRLDF